MKGIKPILAVAALAFAGSAAAQEPSLSSVYIGGSIGSAEYKDSSGDNKDTAWRILGGYQFNRYFAAELGYHNLGEIDTTAGSIKGNAWEFVGIGTYPIVDKFSVYGKLGGYRGELKGLGNKEHNTDFTYGVGLQYDFLKNFGVRGEWQRYSNMGGDNLGGETDVDVVSVGVVFRFQ